MRKKIGHISIRSVFPIAAAVSFVLACITVAGAILAKSSMQGNITSFTLQGPISLSFAGFPHTYILLVWPFICALSGGLFTIAFVWLYNVLSPRIGAVSVTLTE